MRQQLVNARGRVGLHAEQDVRQVRDRIDAMLLAGCHQSVEHTQINASLFVGHKKKIRPSQSDPSQCGLCLVVVWRQRRIPQKTTELSEVSGDVTQRLGQRGAGVEVTMLGACPPQQPREERTRARLSQFEMLLGSQNVGRLRFVFDGVELTDRLKPGRLMLRTSEVASTAPRTARGLGRPRYL